MVGLNKGSSADVSRTGRDVRGRLNVSSRQSQSSPTEAERTCTLPTDAEESTEVYIVAPPHDNVQVEREDKDVSDNLDKSRNSTNEAGRCGGGGEASTPATRDIPVTTLIVEAFANRGGARGGGEEIGELRFRGEMRAEDTVAVAETPTANTAIDAVVGAATSPHQHESLISPPATDALVLVYEDSGRSGGTGDGDLLHASAGSQKVNDSGKEVAAGVAEPSLADSFPGEKLPIAPERARLSAVPANLLSRDKLEGDRGRSSEIPRAGTRVTPRQRKQAGASMLDVVDLKQTAVSGEHTNSTPDDDVLADGGKDEDVQQPSKGFAVSVGVNTSSTVPVVRRVDDSPEAVNSSIRKIGGTDSSNSSSGSNGRGGGNASTSATRVYAAGCDGGKSQPPSPPTTSAAHCDVDESQGDALRATAEVSPRGSPVFPASGKGAEKEHGEGGVVPVNVGRVEEYLSANEPAAASSKGGSRDVSRDMVPRRVDGVNDGRKAANPFADYLARKSAVILQSATRGWLTRRRTMERRLVRAKCVPHLICNPFANKRITNIIIGMSG